MKGHEFQHPKVIEIPKPYVVDKPIEHDDFGGIALPQKLAQVIDLNRNVIEVDFSRGKVV
jgi:hypothetical protein